MISALRQPRVLARALASVGLPLLTLLPFQGAPMGASASGLSGQQLGGLVAEQVTLTPVRGAIVSLLRASADGELETVGVTRSDEEGAFGFEIPTRGIYRIQAEANGLSSPLSDPLDLGPGADSVDDLALLLPSPLLMMAYACQGEVGEGFVTVVGVVRDRDGEVGLPEAIMEARWQEGARTRTLRGQSDAAGRYRICGVPAEAGFVQLQAQLLGRMGAMDEIEVSRPALVFHDVNLDLGTTASGSAGVGGTGVIQEQILMEAAARGLADLTGQLVDQINGQPITQAVIRVEGASLQALTGADGRFTFTGVQPGTYTLDIRHLGYNVQSDPVEVPAGRDVFVSLRVAPQAVVLEGIEVTTRSAVEELARLTPFRRDIVYGEAMAVEESRGSRAYEILRRASPGIQVVELFQEGAPPEVCIQTNRRVQTLTNNGGCQMVQVIVDGTRVSPQEASDFLRNLPAADIESLEFLPPSEATIRYGTGGNVANGVVLVYTRGRGPYASPLRNGIP
jgi:hypothetical protein